MNAHLIERHFAKIGARAQVRPEMRRNRTDGVTIDIGHDGQGEFFDIAMKRTTSVDVRVVDVQPRIRHLLLMSDQVDGNTSSFADTTSDIGSWLRCLNCFCVERADRVRGAEAGRRATAREPTEGQVAQAESSA